MRIYQVTHITDDVVRAFEKLMPQLAPDYPVPGKNELTEIIQSGNTEIFIAEEDEIVGTLSLVFYKIPTGNKATIEDVVVDKPARGKGIGEKLIRFAVDYALKKEIYKIDLTSDPLRVEANSLYRKLGFVKRKSNVYRLTALTAAD
jgi:ribosomal protein S18 acetylase RimI-like enzyme